MTSSSLIQYFRSFIIKLNMIEAQIGQLHLGGKSQLVLPPDAFYWKVYYIFF